MTIMNTIEKYKELKADIVTSLNNEFSKELFAKYPDLNAVMIRGWTPGFNDGEPCTHFQEIILSRECDSMDELFEFDEESESDVNEKLSKEDSAAIMSLLDSLEDIFYDAYETDWELTMKRLSDGTIEVELNDYECEY